MTIDLHDYAQVLFDMDGTVAIGEDAMPGATEFVEACRNAGAAIGFITNASLPTSNEIGKRLAAIGVGRPGDALMTSAIALADEIAENFSTVVFAGQRGLRAALLAAGLEVVGADSARAADLVGDDVAVAVGMFPHQIDAFTPNLVAFLRAGAPCYVPTMEVNWPTPRGLKPGNGQTIAQLQALVAFEPIVCGKPSRVFAERLRSRWHLREPVLIVGDSLQADVALALDNGWDSILLLTGTTSHHDLDGRRPGATLVATDLLDALERTVV
ncbi:MAG: HAD hydrolase-like protein [Pseudolysinimonas sp.]